VTGWGEEGTGDGVVVFAEVETGGGVMADDGVAGKRGTGCGGGLDGEKSYLPLAVTSARGCPAQDH
jgi:hypothetical protein